MRNLCKVQYVYVYQNQNKVFLLLRFLLNFAEKQEGNKKHKDPVRSYFLIIVAIFAMLLLCLPVKVYCRVRRYFQRRQWQRERIERKAQQQSPGNALAVYRKRNDDIFNIESSSSTLEVPKYYPCGGGGDLVAVRRTPMPSPVINLQLAHCASLYGGATEGNEFSRSWQSQGRSPMVVELESGEILEPTAEHNARRPTTTGREAVPGKGTRIVDPTIGTRSQFLLPPLKTFGLRPEPVIVKSPRRLKTSKSTTHLPLHVVTSTPDLPAVFGDTDWNTPGSLLTWKSVSMDELERRRASSSFGASSSTPWLHSQAANDNTKQVVENSEELARTGTDREVSLCDTVFAKPDGPDQSVQGEKPAKDFEFDTGMKPVEDIVVVSDFVCQQNNEGHGHDSADLEQQKVMRSLTFAGENRPMHPKGNIKVGEDIDLPSVIITCSSDNGKSHDVIETLTFGPQVAKGQGSKAIKATKLPYSPTQSESSALATFDFLDLTSSRLGSRRSARNSSLVNSSRNKDHKSCSALPFLGPPETFSNV